MDGDLGRLMSHFPRKGRVEWIGVRPRYRAPVTALESVDAIAGHGLAGDHHASRANGKRQVTLIQAEHLDAVAKLMGIEVVEPASLRRNIVVSGINLHALRDRQFAIGGAKFEGTGTCDPCSRMEEALGRGGYNAMRGHGGITARIVTSGLVRVGDAVESIA